jgi:hypothetical protein
VFVWLVASHADRALVAGILRGGLVVREDSFPQWVLPRTVLHPLLGGRRGPDDPSSGEEYPRGSDVGSEPASRGSLMPWSWLTGRTSPLTRFLGDLGLRSPALMWALAASVPVSTRGPASRLLVRSADMQIADRRAHPRGVVRSRVRMQMVRVTPLVSSGLSVGSGRFPVE